MEEVISPELKDLESKLGMKTPESLLRFMREDHTSDERALDTDENLAMILPEELFDKITKLKLQMEQLRSADVRILRQLLTVHEGMEMLRWLQADRSALTSRTGSLTGSQSSLGEAAASSHGPGADSPSCCSNTPPGLTHTPCPSPPGPTQCSTSFEDACEISDQAWSTVSSSATLKVFLHEDGPVGHGGPTAVLEGPCKMDSNLDQPRSAEPAGFSGLVTAEVIEHSQGSVHCAQEGPELSLGQSEALLGYDTHWCWVESKDDVTFL